jgi:hypothetical protein
MAAVRVTRPSISVRSAPTEYVPIQPWSFGGCVKRTDADCSLVSRRPSASICKPSPSRSTSRQLAFARNCVSVE